MILGILGLAGSGKDQTAKYLVEDHGFTVVSLADPHKRLTKDVFDFSAAQLWGPSEQRNQPDTRYPIGGGQYLTARLALQRIGTEGFRHCYPDIWIEYAIRTAQEILDPVPGFNTRYHQRAGITRTPVTEFPPPATILTGVVLPDVRFMNELDGIRRAGGKVIRVTRACAGLTGIAGLHASEAEQASIPDNALDSVLDNNGTLEELRAKVGLMLAHIRS